MGTTSTTSASPPDPSAIPTHSEISEQPAVAKATIVSHDKPGVKPASPEVLEKADAQRNAISSDVPPPSASPAPHDPLSIGPALHKNTEKKIANTQRLVREAPSAISKLENKETQRAREAQKAETLANCRENVTNPIALHKLIARDPDLAIEVMNEFDKNTSTPERTAAMKNFAAEMCKTSEGRKFLSDFVCKIIKKDIADTQNTLDETQVLRKSEKTGQQLCTAFQNIMMGPIVDPIIEGKLKDMISISRTDEKPLHEKQDGTGIPVIKKHADDLFGALTAALSVKNRIPPEMQAVYQTIGQSVSSRFPEANPETHIASFLFLRKVNVGVGGADQETNKKLGHDLTGVDVKSKNARALSIALQDVVNNYGSDPKSIKLGKWDNALFEGKPNYIASKQDTIKTIGSLLNPKPAEPASPPVKAKGVRFQG